MENWFRGRIVCDVYLVKTVDQLFPFFVFRQSTKIELPFNSNIQTNINPIETETKSENPISNLSNLARKFESLIASMGEKESETAPIWGRTRQSENNNGCRIVCSI